VTWEPDQWPGLGSCLTVWDSPHCLIAKLSSRTGHCLCLTYQNYLTSLTEELCGNHWASFFLRFYNSFPSFVR
jgi:hypothetical protein